MDQKDNTPTKDELETNESVENNVGDEIDTPEDQLSPEKPETVAEENVEKSAIEQMLNDVRAEAQKNMDGWQRTLAEFQNYKRRVEREQREASQRIALETITKVLPMVDDFERAMANVPDDLKENPWLNGVTLIQGKFNKMMDEYDITILDPVGEEFDPLHHQAISMEDSDEYESGHVIETLQKGYLSGDVVLRPALVRVAN